MAYTDLNAEQQSQLDSWASNVRALMGELHQTINKIVAYRDAYWAQDGIAALFTVGGAWPGTEVIPNQSGLAGAAVQTKSDFDALLAQMEGVAIDSSSFTSGFNTDALRQQRIAAAGPENAS